MNLKRLLLGSFNLQAMSTQLLASSSSAPHAATNTFPCVVVFGRPGAGKTTVADTAVAKAEKEQLCCCLGLDLDVCVPEWMRETFAKGIYPTLKQRQDFATICCDYVEQRVDEKRGNNRHVNPAVILSFSFVNTDLRDIFRSRFPHAKWVLLDTSATEATKRINMREDHFYKGEKAGGTEQDKDEPDNNSADSSDADNSEWKFAPVTFDHVVVDGTQPIETNADRVVKTLIEAIRSLE